jgi:hypothetical protein
LKYADTTPINNQTLDPVVIASWNVSDNYVYGFKIKSTSVNQYAGARFTNTAIDVNAYTPLSWWENDASAFGNATGVSNEWCVNQYAYYHSIAKAPIYINFPTSTIITTAILQSTFNASMPTGLTATVNTTSNNITFSNTTTNYWRIDANQRLGIYDPSTPEEAFIISPSNTNQPTSYPIDIAPHNAVLSIGLSLYHDGRTAIAYPTNVDQAQVRPQRRNVVATVYNASQVNYGQYIQYANDSNCWLPCQAENISEIRVQIYGDRMNVIDLHKKDLFIEVDILADAL